jgi:Concanavalin A-like lectin/glucanases superfamily
MAIGNGMYQVAIIGRIGLLFLWLPALLSGQTERPVETAGRFGFGKDTHESPIFIDADSRLGQSPLTIEMWIRAESDSEPHVFVSHGLQTSGDHWELGSLRDTGFLYFSLASTRPATFVSSIAVADGEWHYIAAVVDGGTVKLFIDDRKVVEQTVLPSGAPVHQAGLAIGTRIDERRTTQLTIDDVRISDHARDLVAAPELPLGRDNGTLYLWDFEESRDDYLSRWTPGGETNQRGLPYPHRIAEYEFEEDEDWVDGRWHETDKGPFLAHSFLVPGYALGPKLTAVFLDQQTTMLFDLRKCAFSAALTDSQLKINPARFGLLSRPEIDGQMGWHVSPGKSWMKKSQSGDWQPFDAEEIDFQRKYLHDRHVTFEYRIGDCEVVEHATRSSGPGSNTILRRWECRSVSRPMRLVLAEGVEDFEAVMKIGDAHESPRRIAATFDGQRIKWELHSSNSQSVRLDPQGRDMTLLIEPDSEVIRIELAVKLGEESVDEIAPDEAFAELPPLDELRKPGPRHWGEPLLTIGQPGVDDGKASYVLDELTLPFDNPFRALFFVSGLDFFPDGDAAICTAHGDVWRVTGIDSTLQELCWQRFATGLYQPLGLKIVAGQIVVICRDQLVRLEDANGDGEADIYHALNHDLQTLGGDHAYAMRLESDRAGSLYFLKSSEGPPHGCSLLRWNAESEELEVVASGFRHPYGLGIGPNDEITVADNEGNFVPSSKIDWIEPGGFYGFIEHAGDVASEAKPARPLCFIPKFMDNSCGGQVWAPADRRWGDYHAGEMLHLSWGRCSLHAVLRQQVGNQWQAATVRFPELVFRSGSGTGKFNPRDGQLYVVGLDGWQTGAVQDGCFSRVRYTGRTPAMPEAFEVFANGIRVRYAVELDPDINLDPSRFALEQWNYRWSGTYGSFHYRPDKPDEIGHEPLAIRAISRIDAKTIFLHVDKLQPVDQILLTATVIPVGGAPVTHQIAGTINAMPEPLDIEADSPSGMRLFSKENLVAWCVVPFDAARRGPEARAKMLAGLGIRRLAYDWRDEHIPTWDLEVESLRAAGVDLTAFWAPANTDQPLSEPHWVKIIELIDRHKLNMQLWVMLNDGLVQQTPEGERASTIADWLSPLASELERRSCQLALYNHGGWSGEPENLVAMVRELRRRGMANTGIVYNLHHAHDILPEFEKHLATMRDYLFCLNLNGMRAAGPKILPLGAGDDDLSILAAIVRSGYSGPIGILDHREELDAEESLRQNLEGLGKLTGLLDAQSGLPEK